MDADDGLTKTHAVGRGEKATVETNWISASFEVLGHCRDPHGRAWGKQIRFRDADGRLHMRHVSEETLAWRSGDTLRRLVKRRAEDRALAAAGVRRVPERRHC